MPIFLYHLEKIFEQVLLGGVLCEPPFCDAIKEREVTRGVFLGGSLPGIPISDSLSAPPILLTHTATPTDMEGHRKRSEVRY